MTEEMIIVHHGVKGQKWGVRNGPPYPIDHPVMRKGTKLATVTGGVSPHDAKRSVLQRNKGKWTYTYNPNDEWDRKVYEGPFSVYLRNGRRYANVATHSLVTVRDLRMPSKAERIQEFKDLYNDKKFHKRAIRDMQKIQNLLRAYNIGSESVRNVDLKNLQTKEDYMAAYEVFNHAMESSYKYKSTREYMIRISSKYDAMVDDNNQDVYNEAHDPVIIFRINDVMYDYGDTPVRLLTDSEIVKNRNDVAAELRKKGKDVLY